MFKNHFIFLSPHRDDVCFSVGVLAWSIGGILINLFTRSQYTVQTVEDYSPGTITKVSSLRKSEDAAFMAMSDFTEIDLGWSEAPLRWYGPFARDNLDSEVKAFAPKLHRVLAKFAHTRSNLKPWLFCPMGIGGHRDHLIVRTAVLNGLTEIEKGFFVAFYEDLHYASKTDKRDNGLAEFLPCLNNNQFRRTSLPLGHRADLKLKMVRLYASQFEQSPEDLREFTPALIEEKPHEAIWARREILRDWRVWIRMLCCHRHK